jgi:DNA-binding IclR family transcriptional regulator
VNETKFDTEKIRQPNASQKAFELLKCVAASQSEITLSDLARQLGFSKDTTHGMIQALLQAGALEQGPNRKGFFSGNRRTDRARRGQAARVLGPPFAG